MQGRQMTVLVADDQEIMRDFLSRSIEDLGHRCVTAADGDTCLQSLDALQPDVLFLDLIMPGLKGAASIPRLAEASPSTRIVICSVEDDEHAVRELLSAGAAAYLIKPVRPDDIADVLNTLQPG